MNVTIDLQQAEEILRSSIHAVQNGNWIPVGEFSPQIRDVIKGTHKTYRYVLMNGLLAKATNGACNPIVLQAKSTLNGAFDARSLCHKVVVPIESELLGDRLGASNEPFLNKPARYTELSCDNPVRSGNDRVLLNNAISVLNSSTTSEIALGHLKDAIYWTFQRESRNLGDYLANNQRGIPQASLINFAQDLISKSCEGETCALLAGATFELLGIVSRRTLDVRTHKVNQAGTSSNEVSDVDVYENKALLYTAEVKDKLFTSQDVSHAINKAAIAGHNSLIFIKGPSGLLTNCSEQDLVNYWIRKGINLYFTGVIDQFKTILSLTPEIDHYHFISILNHHASLARVKDETFSHLTSCARRANW